MLRSMMHLLALSSMCFGVAGPLIALPASAPVAKPVVPVAKAVLNSVTDDTGMWTITVSGPPGTSAMATWPILSDVMGAVMVTVGPDDLGSNHLRFAAASDAVFDFTLYTPGYSSKSIRNVGSAGATLTIGLPQKHRTDASGR